MIEKLSHVTVFVLDQDAALVFYRDKLGFEVRNDNRMEGFRWLTVGPKTQPGLELILMPIAENPMMPAEVAASSANWSSAGYSGSGCSRHPTAAGPMRS